MTAEIENEKEHAPCLCGAYDHANLECFEDDDTEHYADCRCPECDPEYNRCNGGSGCEGTIYGCGACYVHCICGGEQHYPTPRSELDNC